MRKSSAIAAFVFSLKLSTADRYSRARRLRRPKNINTENLETVNGESGVQGQPRTLNNAEATTQLDHSNTMKSLLNVDARWAHLINGQFGLPL